MSMLGKLKRSADRTHRGAVFREDGAPGQVDERGSGMVQTDAIEGVVDGVFRFHYDLFSDVLYIRLLSSEDAPTFGDVTDDGDILLRDETTDRAVGLTVVSWWKRYGQGALPDSILEISRRIEPLVQRLAA